MAETHRVSAPTSNEPRFHQLIKKVEVLLGVEGSDISVVALLTSASIIINKRSRGAAADDDRSFASGNRIKKRPKLSIEPLSASAPAWGSCGISPSPTQRAFVTKALLLQEANTLTKTDSPSENTRSKTKRHV